MEHIIFFGESWDEANRPFHIEMTGITYPDATYHITRPNSHIYCFEYVIDGEGVVWVDNRVNHPVKGDLYILPKGSHHDYYASPEHPFEKIWMNVSGPLCDELIRIYNLTGILLVKQIDIYPMFQEFLSTCENKELSLDEIYSRCSVLFHKIIIQISEHLSVNTQDTSAEATNEIKAFIDRHIYERINLEVLSKHIGLSPSQITRVFKKAFQQTPYDYILTRKIDTAKVLLKNTSLSVKEIAYKLNFTDEHYFSNIFLKKTGIRPGKY